MLNGTSEILTVLRNESRCAECISDSNCTSEIQANTDISGMLWNCLGHSSLHEFMLQQIVFSNYLSLSVQFTWVNYFSQMTMATTTRTMIWSTKSTSPQVMLFFLCSASSTFISLNPHSCASWSFHHLTAAGNHVVREEMFERHAQLLPSLHISDSSNGYSQWLVLGNSPNQSTLQVFFHERQHTMPLPLFPSVQWKVKIH